MSILARGTSGNESVMGLLNMMSDPVAFKEKLAELNEKERVLNEKIALAGEAEQIYVIKQMIQEREAESVQMIRDAAEKAQGVIEAANRQGNAIIQDARENAERMIEATVTQKNQIVADAESKLAKVLHECEQERLRAQELANSLQVEAKRLNEFKQELDERYLKLSEKELALTEQQTILERKNNLLSAQKLEQDQLQQQIKIMLQAMQEDLNNLKAK